MFPGLPETSKMYIFALIVHHLRTNKTFMFPKFIQVGFYLQGGGAYIRLAYIRDVNWVSYLVGIYSGGAYIGGAVLTGFYGILINLYSNELQIYFALRNTYKLLQ